MLFTVDIQSPAQVQCVTLGQVQPGYGCKTALFHISREDLGYTNEFPQESETGLEVIPGRIELSMLLDMFGRCVVWDGVKSAQVLSYKEFHWPGHVMAHLPIYLRFTVLQTHVRLGCTDIDWLCELCNENDHVACQLTIRQRVYI